MIILKSYHYISDFKKGEIVRLDKKIDIIYRNYNQTINKGTVIKLRNECRKSGRKIFLCNNFELAIKLKLDGFYIPSFNRSLQMKYKSTIKFQIIGSAHNLKEIRIKENQGVDTIVLSPIFKIKKQNNFLNINRFNLLSKLTKKKVIALGGINIKNIKKLKLLNCVGYASIKYLKNKNKLDVIRK